ncbi:FAD-dependent monooxygenase [Paenarthrobacter sp. PH39-S1]|uniref:FAD-dependent oxidoreductase n=1 Tax=Paenarthrobacter sp. PH39-S1 TaxID=3046204 RepID=UPI0024B8A93D|nr:FAD-dependent monooxygenase [Paenarthrobacter sp. PH39-S1]MDJ0356611.1 FAD-dependent monooxygenase [Paenarthrobacter sp. PH39-S1]
MIASHSDVLVVGAGPVGLTAAGILQRRGHAVTIIDAAGESDSTSRAAVIHPRTLEVLEGVGATDRILSEGVKVPVFTVREREKILARLNFGELKTRYPFTVMLQQWRTERILEDLLEEHGGRVHRRVRATSVVPTPEGSAVSLLHANGVRSEVTARFVVGADGLHSTVRSEAGIAFSGGTYEQSFILADIEMTWPLPSDEVQLFFSAEGLVVIAPLPGGHHRVVATVDRAEEHPSLETIASLLAQRGPKGTRVERLVWSSRFRVQHRLAASYRNGSVFLAGDAAHVHSPAGGQGMNTGIQDAVDLARTLILALEGKGVEAELDGYEARRRPVAQAVVALTDRMTRVATVKGPLARNARNVAVGVVLSVPALRHRLAERIGELR